MMPRGFWFSMLICSLVGALVHVELYSVASCLGLWFVLVVLFAIRDELEAIRLARRA